MKQRVISAVVAFAIFIPIFIIGGLPFNLAFYILTLLGLREFMKVKEKEKKFPDFIRLVAYILTTLLYFVLTIFLVLDYHVVNFLSSTKIFIFPIDISSVLWYTIRVE